MKKRQAILVGALAVFVSIVAAPGAWGETDAAKKAMSIRMELQGKQRAMTPYAYIDLTERLWIDFLSEYPSAPEAAEAHLTLGFIYAQTGRHEQAVQHLEGYRDVEGDKKMNERSKAMVTLAGSYLALERFDEAEVLLKELSAPSTGRDHRISQMASQQLARLGTLRKLRIGLPALDFSGKTAVGTPISLEDYRGKVVLLDFWASWCVPCRKEMPNVRQIYEQYHGKGFEIIGVSLDDKEEKFKEYMESEKLTWPQIFDGNGWRSEIGQLYAVNAIPATYLIDREGIIRYKNVRGNELGKAVKQLVGEK